MGIENTGAADIQARIAQIQAQLATMRTANGTTTSSSSSSATTTRSASAFASSLADAVGTAGSVAASSTTVSSGKLNAKGVPVDLAKYGNGKVPASALESMGVGTHKLWSPAAESFQKMRADAEKVGVKIGVTDSYRSYDEQVALARKKGLYSQGGLAAKPGTSDHGWGLSTDLDLNDRALTWMRDNAKKYGFKENVPRESWHWTYSPTSS